MFALCEDNFSHFTQFSHKLESCSHNLVVRQSPVFDVHDPRIRIRDNDIKHKNVREHFLA